MPTSPTARTGPRAGLAAVLLLAAALLAPAPPAPSSPPAAPGLLAAQERPHWRPPIPGARPEEVRRAFAAPPQPWGRGHRGVDLAAGLGVLLAPADGVVRFSGRVVDRPVLTIAHEDGLVSSFEPVLTDLPVGTPVRAGQPVGVLDPSAPHCLRPCVHWGVRREDAWRIGGGVFDRYVDPLWLIGWSGPSVLWPQNGPRPPGVPAAAALAPTAPR